MKKQNNIVAAPAAGQAGLAKLDELVQWDPELYHRGPLGIPDARMAVFSGGGFYRVEDVREVFSTLAAPVAADTEQAIDEQSDIDRFWNKAIEAEAEANRLRQENAALHAALKQITETPSQCIAIADAALSASN